MAIANIPGVIGDMLSGVREHPVLLMLVIMTIILVVGTALDFIPTILILTPVLLPIAKSAGIDPVYFGVMFIMAGAIGLLTPPVGAVLNVVCAVGNMRYTDAVRGVVPFLIVQAFLILLLALFPQLVIVPANWFY